MLYGSESFNIILISFLGKSDNISYDVGSRPKNGPSLGPLFTVFCLQDVAYVDYLRFVDEDRLETLWIIRIKRQGQGSKSQLAIWTWKLRDKPFDNTPIDHFPIVDMCCLINITFVCFQRSSCFGQLTNNFHFIICPSNPILKKKLTTAPAPRGSFIDLGVGPGFGTLVHRRRSPMERLRRFAISFWLFGASICNHSLGRWPNNFWLGNIFDLKKWCSCLCSESSTTVAYFVLGPGWLKATQNWGKWRAKATRWNKKL